MFDSQCDLAALVYEPGQDPDGILREFAADLNARNYRAVGLVQLGRHCTGEVRLAGRELDDQVLDPQEDVAGCAQVRRSGTGHQTVIPVRTASPSMRTGIHSRSTVAPSFS